VVDSANHWGVIAPPAAGSLSYSTQPVKSRVRVERDAFGGVTITILPITLRTLALVSLFISSIGALLLVALILHDRYGSPLAVLFLRPAVAVGWALVWAVLTPLQAAAAVLFNVLFINKTTFVRVCDEVISVRCLRWYWRSRRDLPVRSVRGTRVTGMNFLALVDADGKVLCKLSVPDTVDLPWLSLAIRDAIALAVAVPEPAASQGRWGGFD
jgi:hypothetical protein